MVIKRQGWKGVLFEVNRNSNSVLYHSRGDDVSRATKGITDATMVSEAKLVSKDIVATLQSDIIVVTMCSKVIVATVRTKVIVATL
jgi:hypothetical protein